MAGKKAKSPRPKHRGKTRTRATAARPKAPAARPKARRQPEPPRRTPAARPATPAAPAAAPPPRAAEADGPRSDRWEATVEGQELFREGRLEAAIGALTEVLTANPYNEYAAFFLGSALHTRGNLEAARAAFERAIDISPEFLGAWVGLGHLLLDAGENHAAVDCAKAILRLRANDEDGNFLLGLGSARLGRYALAASAFEMVLGGRPSLELRAETVRLLELVKAAAFDEPEGGELPS